MTEPRRITDRDDPAYNPGANPGPGEVGRTLIEVSPECRGMCKGDRPAWESPAQWGRDQGGKKVIWCPCCNTVLVAAKPELEGSVDRRIIAQVRPPNLNPQLQANERVMTCRTCRYDVRVLKDVKPL